MATPFPRTLARLAGYATGRPVYGAACPEISGKQVVRLAGFVQGRPVYATAIPWLKTLARLVGYAVNRPVYAAADCIPGSTSGSGSGSSGSGSSGSGSSGSGSSESPLSPSLPSLGSSAVSGSSGSGSVSASASVSESLPSLGSSVSGSVPSGSVPSGSLSGSGSLSERVLTPCCDTPVPTNLIALITNKTGNCACLPDEVAMTYAGISGGSYNWASEQYPANPPCGPCVVSLECRPDGLGGSDWRADKASCAVFDTLVSVTCEPFEIVFDIDNTLGTNCQGTYRITFIEAP